MDDRDFLKEAYRIAVSSKDPSTQNGAIIVRDNMILLLEQIIFLLVLLKQKNAGLRDRKNILMWSMLKETQFI